MSDFLEPLLELKPSADLKLRAAWDGLSTESQMRLLTAADEANRHLPDEVARKALSSPNAYVRFLAGKRVKPGPSLLGKTDSPLAEAARMDPDPLVQSTQPSVRGERNEPDFPPKFWAWPEAVRFAYVGDLARTATFFWGHGAEHAVKLLDFALTSGVPEEETSDVAVEYVETLRTVADSRIYVHPLWAFLPRCPIWLAAYLVRRLPAYWIGHDLARELLKRRENEFLGLFFDRTEPSLRGLRKAILRSNVLELDRETRAAYASPDRLRSRLRSVAADLRGPGAAAFAFVVLAFIVLVLAEASVQTTSFVAAAAGLTVLLKSFWPVRQRLDGR